MRDEFVSAIRSNQPSFEIDLADDVIERLTEYYELVQQHNPILHLVGPSSPAEFATRHILESLTMLKFLPDSARFADIGAGAGLPSLPCLIARPDLKAVLIESKEKKTEFLRTAATKLGLENRAKVINKQFSEVTRPHVSLVTCRALDKFTDRLPQLLRWAGTKELLLFGGTGLSEALEKANRNYTSHLLPLSERRYLFSVTPSPSP